jgi:pyocin large subunit-like protein
MIKKIDAKKFGQNETYETHNIHFQRQHFRSWATASTEPINFSTANKGTKCRTKNEVKCFLPLLSTFSSMNNDFGRKSV